MNTDTIFFSNKINKAVQLLTYSDIMMISGWGIVSPIFAVYVTEQIEGGSIELVGISSAIYFICKSFLQIPVARLLDKHRGEHDDFFALIAGSVLICMSAAMYIFISKPWELILSQVVQGVGGALASPAWLGIFTRHVDKNKEGFEWSLYGTTTDIGASVTAALSGYLAAYLGYRNLFLLVTLSLLAGTIFLTTMASELKRQT